MISEPKILRAIYKFEERKTLKKKWWGLNKYEEKIYPEGYYEKDGITPVTVEYLQNFIIPDKDSPNLFYLCEFGKLIFEDDDEVFVRRLTFRNYKSEKEFMEGLNTI